MKRLSVILVIIFSLCIVYTGPVFAADLKVGFVDLKKAFEESLAGKQAKLEFADKAKVYQEELDKRKQKLEATRQEYEGQKIMLSEDARKNKERELRDQFRELQDLFKDNQESLRALDEQITKGILEEISKLVEKYSKDNGYDLVLEKTESAILFAQDSMEITAKIIELFNARHLKNKK